MGYFEKIFTSSNPFDMDSVLDVVTPCINSNTATILQVIFTEEELLAALHQIHPNKAPKSNGILALFFHKFWHVINKDVIYTVIAILNSNIDPSFLNKTHVVLILKVQNPKNMIFSLCSVIFKIITKLITNRLK